VRLTVYDVHGRRVAVLLDKMEPAGWRTAAWEGRDDAGREVGSGTYFLRLEAGETVQVRRAVLVR
jgi:flagellar hook assembly protein FlgD